MSSSSSSPIDENLDDALHAAADSVSDSVTASLDESSAIAASAHPAPAGSGRRGTRKNPGGAKRKLAEIISTASADEASSASSDASSSSVEGGPFIQIGVSPAVPPLPAKDANRMC